MLYALNFWEIECTPNRGRSFPHWLASMEHCPWKNQKNNWTNVDLTVLSPLDSSKFYLLCCCRTLLGTRTAAAHQICYKTCHQDSHGYLLDEHGVFLQFLNCAGISEIIADSLVECERYTRLNGWWLLIPLMSKARRQHEKVASVFNWKTQPATMARSAHWKETKEMKSWD